VYEANIYRQSDFEEELCYSGFENEEATTFMLCLFHHRDLTSQVLLASINQTFATAQKTLGHRHQVLELALAATFYVCYVQVYSQDRVSHILHL